MITTTTTTTTTTIIIIIIIIIASLIHDFSAMLHIPARVMFNQTQKPIRHTNYFPPPQPFKPQLTPDSVYIPRHNDILHHYSEKPHNNLITFVTSEEQIWGVLQWRVSLAGCDCRLYLDTHTHTHTHTHTNVTHTTQKLLSAPPQSQLSLKGYRSPPPKLRRLFITTEVGRT